MSDKQNNDLLARFNDNLITFTEWNIGDKLQVVFYDSRPHPVKLGIVVDFRHNNDYDLCLDVRWVEYPLHTHFHPPISLLNPRNTSYGITKIGTTLP